MNVGSNHNKTVTAADAITCLRGAVDCYEFIMQSAAFCVCTVVRTVAYVFIMAVAAVL